MELMELGRRILDQPESDLASDVDEIDEVEDEAGEETGVVLGFGSNAESQLAPASTGNEIRQPMEIDGLGEVKPRFLE